MNFDTKIVIVIDENLAVWQKLNVTAFLTSGIVAANEGLTGQNYQVGSGHIPGKQTVNFGGYPWLLNSFFPTSYIFQPPEIPASRVDRLANKLAMLEVIVATLDHPQTVVLGTLGDSY